MLFSFVLNVFLFDIREFGLFELTCLINMYKDLVSFNCLPENDNRVVAARDSLTFTFGFRVSVCVLFIFLIFFILLILENVIFS